MDINEHRRTVWLVAGQGQGTLKYTESNSEVLTGNDIINCFCSRKCP